MSFEENLRINWDEKRDDLLLRAEAVADKIDEKFFREIERQLWDVDNALPTDHNRKIIGRIARIIEALEARK